MLQSHTYDSRAMSSSSMPRSIAASHFMPSPGLVPYISNTSNISTSHGHQLPTFAGNSSYGPLPQHRVVSYSNSYAQPRIQHSMMTSSVEAVPTSAAEYHVPLSQDYMKEQLSPMVKQDPYMLSSHGSWNTRPIDQPNAFAPTPIATNSEATFSTDVDTLMKVIQSKASDSDSTNDEASAIEKHSSDEKLANKKRYKCEFAGCHKAFCQKTHLDIHFRSHTGYKPHRCTYHDEDGPCNETFSQRGNLKTHMRRHTKDRPYQCLICHKSFAQKGNVKAHQIVHSGVKPFTCLLEDCGKEFSQLGNLKSHQNKFHNDMLKELTAKFASIKEGDYVSDADKELWAYLAKLYKNSNKGIKGRGKDRKVSSPASSRGQSASRMYPLDTNMLPMSGLPLIGHDMRSAGRQLSQDSHGRGFEGFDADESAMSSQGGSSTAGSIYDAPVHNVHSGFAFGERMY